VIGGGDWSADRLIPDCVRALREGVVPTLRRPDARRPWQHVLEPLRGYLLLGLRLLAQPPEFAEAWNFGPRADDARTVGEVATEVCRLWGQVGPELPAATAPYHETRMLRLCSDKALARLSWQPRWGVQRALAETVAWYKAQHDGRDMRAFCVSQIEAHEHSQ